MQDSQKERGGDGRIEGRETDNRQEIREAVGDTNGREEGKKEEDMTDRRAVRLSKRVAGKKGR